MGARWPGYDKLLLAVNPFVIPFDCYLPRFPKGTQIPPHLDPIHYRLNNIVKRSPVGGEFVCADPIFQTRRIKFIPRTRGIGSAPDF
jgi:hypothetical protein